MTRIALATLVLCTGCLHGSLFRNTSRVRAEAAADSLYRSALTQLLPSNPNGSIDSAITLLNAYLKAPEHVKHMAEATTLLALARDAQQLAHVQAALQQARAEARSESAERTRAESGASGREESAVREIERLKAELARANDELERIKKRLATPPTSKP